VTFNATTTIATVVKIAGEVATAFLPGGAIIAGLTVPDMIGVISGIANGLPDVIAAYEAIKAAVDGGAAPTPTDLAALKAALDAADDAVQTEVAELDTAGKA
jgi:hypothetical protein